MYHLARREIWFLRSDVTPDSFIYCTYKKFTKKNPQIYLLSFPFILFTNKRQYCFETWQFKVSKKKKKKLFDFQSNTLET